MQILFLGVEESPRNTTATASCSFPFKWNGHTYNACTTAGVTNSEGRYWCAINTENSSEDMEGTGKWVWCNS